MLDMCSNAGLEKGNMPAKSRRNGEQQETSVRDEDGAKSGGGQKLQMMNRQGRC